MDQRNVLYNMSVLHKWLFSTYNVYIYIHIHTLLLFRDVTAATWGGSSAPSSEEGESTSSLPGGGGELDDTRADMELTCTAALGTCKS